jgi:hypothetical protein
LKGLRQAVDEGLGGLAEVPLQVAAESRAVVENAEQLRLLPLPRGGQDGARALVKVQVPEAVYVRDFVRAPLACHERLAVRGLAMAMFSAAQEASALHETAYGRIARYRAEALLAGQRDEVVVVQLEGPARMVAMLLDDGLLERRAETRMGPGVGGDLARERGERIVGAAGDVPPALDALEREVDGLAGRGVSPRARGERLDARLELAVVGGGGQERTEDLKAQTCPSHPRARRGSVIGHGPPGCGPCRSERARTYADGKNAGSAIFCANRVDRRGYITPLTQRDPPGQLVVVYPMRQPRLGRRRAWPHSLAHDERNDLVGASSGLAIERTDVQEVLRRA